MFFESFPFGEIHKYPPRVFKVHKERLKTVEETVPANPWIRCHILLFVDDHTS